MTHIKSHNKAESISPEETQSFSLFVLMMLKRKKRALRLPKAALVKDPRIKAQFYQNTTFRCGGFDCVCTARTVVACTPTVQPQVIQKSLQWKEKLSYRLKRDFYLPVQAISISVLAPCVRPRSTCQSQIDITLVHRDNLGHRRPLAYLFQPSEKTKFVLHWLEKPGPK